MRNFPKGGVGCQLKIDRSDFFFSRIKPIKWGFFKGFKLRILLTILTPLRKKFMFEIFEIDSREHVKYMTFEMCHKV